MLSNISYKTFPAAADGAICTQVEDTKSAHLDEMLIVCALTLALGHVLTTVSVFRKPHALMDSVVDQGRVFQIFRRARGCIVPAGLK